MTNASDELAACNRSIGTAAQTTTTALATGLINQFSSRCSRRLAKPAANQSIKQAGSQLRAGYKLTLHSAVVTGRSIARDGLVETFRYV